MTLTSRYEKKKKNTRFITAQGGGANASDVKSSRDAQTEKNRVLHGAIREPLQEKDFQTRLGYVPAAATSIYTRKAQF